MKRQRFEAAANPGRPVPWTVIVLLMPAMVLCALVLPALLLLGAARQRQRSPDIPLGDHRFVVQSFRPGASSIWNDEAWSCIRAEAKRYLDDRKQRSPELKWRLITRKHNEKDETTGEPCDWITPA